MSHYNPANDPAIACGIQEAYGFKVGDKVEYTNSYGLIFGPYNVVGFVQEPDPQFMPENTVYINTDSPWFPVKPSSLRKTDAQGSGGFLRKTAERVKADAKCPNRGEDCAYTMECMWGVDGWCDRPEGNLCELQKTA